MATLKHLTGTVVGDMPGLVLRAFASSVMFRLLAVEGGRGENI